MMSPLSSGHDHLAWRLSWIVRTKQPLTILCLKNCAEKPFLGGDVDLK